MSYLSADEQYVQKIEKYTGKIEEAFGQIKNLNGAEIDGGLIGYALTQCLTNLYETVTRINNDMLSEKLWPIIKRTRTTRNIASHDYDSINWDIVKENCKEILKLLSPEFINDCYVICEEEKKKTKDYTYKA